MRLASGICPTLDLLAAGAPIGLGVDGSASNDASNMILEARQALYIQRLRYGAEKITRFVRVRNPWGHCHTVYEKNAQGKIEMKDSTNAVTEGINEIELNDFMERFRGVTYTDPVAIMEKQRIEAEAVRKEEQEEKKRIALEETRKTTQEEVKGEQ